MDKVSLRKEVQKLVGEAEMEQALDLLLSFLGKDPAYLNLYNITLQAKSLYNRTDRDESDGVLSQEDAKLNYNQVNRQILDVLQKLNKEDQIAAGIGNSTGRRLQRNILLGIALLAVLAIIGVALYRTDSFGSNNNIPIDGPEPGESCPEFPLDSNINVLVLPFKDLNPDSETGLNVRIARLIEIRLDEFKNKYKTDFDIAVKEDLLIEHFPNQMSEAETIAASCDAELIIWGSAETTTDQSDIIITRYKFLNIENLSLHKLVLSSDTDIDTISTQSSIITNGELTEGIEKTLQYIFGIIAHESGNASAVIASFRELNLQDTTASFTKDVLLADAYIVEDSSEQALKKTAHLNEIHPEYFLAQNNKAVMAYTMKEYDESYQRLVVAEQLSKKPQPEINRSKAIALNKATKPENFPRQEIEVKKIEKSPVDIKSKDEKKNKSNRNPPSKTRAEAEISTGNFEELLKTEDGIIKLLRENPRDPYLWKRLTTMVQSKEEEDFEESFERLSKLAQVLKAEDLFYNTPLGQWWKIRQTLPF